MNDERGLSPAEVSELLGVSTSTLRTYAAKFDPLLSSGAHGGARGRGAGYNHRRYGTEDLEILRRAKELLDAGLSYDATLRQLGGGTLLSRPISAGRSRAARMPRATRPASALARSAGAGRVAQTKNHPGEPDRPLDPSRSAATSVADARGAAEPRAPVLPRASVAIPEPISIPMELDALEAGLRQAFAELIAPIHAEIQELATTLESVEERIAPIRSELHQLAARIEAVEELTKRGQHLAEQRADDGQRAAEESSLLLIRLQARLDEVVGRLDRLTNPTPQRGWLDRLVRRSPTLSDDGG